MQIILMLQDEAFNTPVVEKKKDKAKTDSLEMIRERCEQFKIPSEWIMNTLTVFNGQLISEVYVENYDEIMEHLGIEDDEEVFFLYLDKKLTRTDAFALTSRGFRAVNKKYTYDIKWKDFATVRVRQFLMTLWIGTETIMDLPYAAGRVAELLQDVRNLAKLMLLEKGNKA